MPAKRRYNLLCPIARSLDVLGDRWALLILRDLHAGPARFGELEHGLGIATNLLTTRLQELVEHGLVTKRSIAGQDHYVLTEIGEATDRIVWELAQFGLHLEPGGEVRRPGNLRTLVLPLRFALAALPERPTLTARLVVDGDVITVRTTAQSATVDYGDTVAIDEPAVEIRTAYEPLLAVAEGHTDPMTFAIEHVDVVGDEAAGRSFLAMVGQAYDR